ncbi:hypothetical protein F7725_007000 [Dissostichus mawsoni]|uniref:Uncharacterized protein n=1 Tax=Dissostichus mawsoni TaxID=36200 RepID=A0A7J5XYG2_DISMA|nr:hypothetical protein F7725_007000 [Dissostichus mawsoni]
MVCPPHLTMRDRDRQRKRSRGYALLPAGKVDNLSDSSHSEISSRSSICSVDSVPPPGLDDRCSSSSRTSSAAFAVTTATTAAPPIAESSAASHAHELTPDHTSLDSVGDSGGQLDSPPSSCRPWDHGIHGHPLALPHTHLGGFKHTHLAGPIAEVEAAAGHTWANEDATKHHSRQSSSDLSNQSRQSWASSGSLSDTYEGNYGTVKRRNTSEHASSPTNEEGGQSTDPAYKTVTSSTDKGLIVYCITSPSKDERYRAPPPTPPGYQGLALGDLGLSDGVVGGHGVLLPRPPPPQTSRIQRGAAEEQTAAEPRSGGGTGRGAEAGGEPSPPQAGGPDRRPPQVHSRPPSICSPPRIWLTARMMSKCQRCEGGVSTLTHTFSHTDQVVSLRRWTELTAFQSTFSKPRPHSPV